MQSTEKIHVKSDSTEVKRHRTSVNIPSDLAERLAEIISIEHYGVQTAAINEIIKTYIQCYEMVLEAYPLDPRGASARIITIIEEDHERRTQAQSNLCA